MLHPFLPFLGFVRAGVTTYCSTLFAVSFFLFFFFFFFDTRGDPLSPSIPHKYDVILAADCVYFEPAFPLLVRTLADLVPDESVEVLFCYKKRRKVRSITSELIFHLIYRTSSVQADKRFFTLLKKEFTWAEVCAKPVLEISVSHGPTRRSWMM